MTRRRYIDFCSVLVLSLSSSVFANNTHHQYYAPERSQYYPKPVVISALENIDEALSAEQANLLPLSESAQVGQRNSAMRLQVLSANKSKQRGELTAPDGSSYLNVRLRVTNAHAKGLVSKAALEGKKDFTRGVRSPFGGASKPAEKVEADYTVLIKDIDKHFYVSADGLTYPLRPDLNRAVDGVRASDSTNESESTYRSNIELTKQGQSTILNLVFEVPENAEHIDVHYLDYALGHIVLPVSGGGAKAFALTAFECPLASAQHRLAEFCVHSIEPVNEYESYKAAPGKQLLKANLSAISQAQAGDQRAILEIKPDGYVWLKDANNHFAIARPVASGMLRFAPEIRTAQHVVFEVAQTFKASELVVQLGNEVVSAKIAETAANTPIVIGSLKDGDHTELMLHGISKNEDAIFADISVKSLQPEKRVNISLGNQFQLLVKSESGSTGSSNDSSGTKVTNLNRVLSQAHPFGRGQNFEIPPQQTFRFTLAYQAEALPAALRITGAADKTDIDLSSIEIQATASVSAIDELASERVDETTNNLSDTQASEVAVTQNGSAILAQMEGTLDNPEPLNIEEEGIAENVAEVEPNNAIEDALELGERDSGFVLTGKYDNKKNRNAEPDFFTFTNTAAPKLWFFSVRGKSIVDVSISNEQGTVSFATRGVGKSNTLLIPNAPLQNERYFIQIRTRAPKDTVDTAYKLTAIPTRPADSGEETEPNNDLLLADRLRYGEARTGYITDSVDQDFYTFSVTAENEKIAYLLKPPTTGEFSLTVSERIAGSGLKQLHRVDAVNPGEFMRGFLSLMPGTYVLSVRARKVTEPLEPYQVKLERLNQFQPVADLEPNDAIEFARELLPSSTTTGELFGRSDIDWYRLPKGIDGLVVTLPGALESERKPRLAARIFDVNGKKRTDLNWNKETESFSADFDTSEENFLRLSGGLSYEIHQNKESLEQSPVSLSILNADTHAQAFVYAAQQVRVPVLLRNESDQPQDVSLHSSVNRFAWQVVQPQREFTLAANDTLDTELLINIAPDAPETSDAVLDVQLSINEQPMQMRTLSLSTECGVASINPYSAWTLPNALLGGKNVALSAFGASITGLEAYPEGNKRDQIRNKQQRLIRSITTDDSYWRAVLNDKVSDETVVVQLAGNTAVPIVGSIFKLPVTASTSETPTDLEILLSSDNQQFQSVWRGRLPLVKAEHSVVFDKPTIAKFAKLVVHASGAENKMASLIQWKLVSEPASSIPGLGEFNVGSAELGGHLVSASTVELTGKMRDVINRPLRKTTGQVKQSENTSLDWVIGFHDQRAAKLASIRWNYGKRDESSPVTAPELVNVQSSTTSPLGPWETVGEFRLSTANALAEQSVLDFNKPVWARYLRFSLPVMEERKRWNLPQTIDVIEHAESDEYVSILGEWGESASRSYFEYENQNAPAATLKQLPANTERALASHLRDNEPVYNQVLLGSYDNWYYIDVAEGRNRLFLQVTGDPAISMEFKLMNENNEPVELLESENDDGSLFLNANVSAGRYFLHVIEPPRSIVITWDTSGSVRNYLPTIYDAVNQFTQQVQPALEFVNLQPFTGKGETLLKDFTDDPAKLGAALRSMKRASGSSDAEGNLLSATETLRTRTGTKAVIMLTDADSGSPAKTSVELWESLKLVKPRIFTMEIHRGGNSLHQQDKMQNWAAVQTGYYSKFNTDKELRNGFKRASCHLRRPARYSLISTTTYEAPAEPGAIKLIAQENETEVTTSSALALILDASGSMHKKLGDSTRLNVARDILSDLVLNVIPAGKPVALRIFGHKEERSCRTDLEVPLSPANPARLAKAIQRANAQAYAKTPLAESLSLVESDLDSVSGAKNVILVTDGEESCGGDPASAIQSLRNKGLNVRVNIVGFAIDDEKLKQSFTSWAKLGGGEYFDAPDAASLKAGLQQALQYPYNVLSSEGAVLASGIVGGKSVTVPEGRYQVQVLSEPPMLIENVEIRSGELTERTVN